MLAKLSYSLEKRFNMQLDAYNYWSYMLLKKIHLHDFWVWRLFYQPNKEIASLVKRNNHLRGEKIQRKFCCDICLIFRNIYARNLIKN